METKTTDKHKRHKATMQLNRKLMKRGLKALEGRTMKVTIAEYLRMQHDSPAPAPPPQPPRWIDSPPGEDLYSPPNEALPGFIPQA